MKVIKNIPKKSSWTSRYDFDTSSLDKDNPTIRVENKKLEIINVYDKELLQEELFYASILLLDNLEKYELPTGTSGEAKIGEISVYNMCIKGLFNKKDAGKIGFPTISIETSFGLNYISLKPDNDGLIISTLGEGIAEKIFDDSKKDLEKILHCRDSGMMYFGERRLGSLTSTNHIFRKGGYRLIN